MTHLPKISKTKTPEPIDGFPLQHYSYSALKEYSTNPIKFNMLYRQRQWPNTAQNASGVVGKAFHAAMETYYGGNKEIAVDSKSAALESALEVGLKFIEEYPDGFILYNTVYKNKDKMKESVSFAITSYAKEIGWVREGTKLVETEDEIVEHVDVSWRGRQVSMPVKLKAFIDKVEYRDDKLVLVDYKTCRSFTDPEKIDGKKIIQAIQYYFAAYAKYGVEPYSFVYEEVKLSKNQDGGRQVREYEIIYADNELYFDFYMRLYEDATRAVIMDAPMVPNVETMFDNEVGIIAYIHRLDMPDEQAEQMKKLKIDNITELLKAKIQTASSMKTLMKMAEKQFVEAAKIDYSKMEPQEKVRTKLMEHGLLLDFEDVVQGHSVALYRYTPSAGIKMKRLEGYTADIEQVLGVSGVRILAPIPDTTFVGIEVPMKERSFPPSAIPTFDDMNVLIGYDVYGKAIIRNIIEMPHQLVSGETGSGKSVYLDGYISQVLKKENVNLILCDPKGTEMMHFEDDAHSYGVSVREIHAILTKQVAEMNSRFKKLKALKKRDIAGTGIPYNVIVIDEFGDIIMQNEKEKRNKKSATTHIGRTGKVSESAEITEYEVNLSQEVMDMIQILSQKGRAAGLHITIATQRPSVDVITGAIRANFPTKVAFRAAKAIDSMVVLEQLGAEKLLGKGDMLLSDQKGITRAQGVKIDI